MEVFAIVRVVKFDLRFQLKEFPVDSAMTYSMEILLEEIQLVATKKGVFDYGDESILIANFEMFGLPKFMTRQQNDNS